jgi:CRISPR-associated protein Cst1
MELLDKARDDHYVPLWMLTELFMEEVLGMGQNRIEAIRDLGDLLASEALDHDHRLLQSAVRLRSYAGVRRLLVRLGALRLKRGDPPVVTLKTFELIFDEVLEVPQVDWRLPWDLMLIRFMESLHAHKERLGEVAGDVELDEDEDLSAIS